MHTAILNSNDIAINLTVESYRSCLLFDKNRLPIFVDESVIGVLITLQLMRLCERSYIAGMQYLDKTFDWELTSPRRDDRPC